MYHQRFLQPPTSGMAKQQAALVGFAHAAIRQQHAVLDVPFWQDDLAEILAIASQIRQNFRRLIVLGTGGSSLGGMMLTELAMQAHSIEHPRYEVVFAENLDPVSLRRILEPSALKESFILAISKSGGTVEPLFLALIVAEKLANLGCQLPQHMAVLVGEGESPMRRFAEDHALRIIHHPSAIGGRYSVLTAVGLLPAAVMGLDVAAIRAGAQTVVTGIAAGVDASAPLIGAAWHAALLDAGISQSIFMPYCDRLFAMGSWWRQLVAESLGKQGRGITPVRSLGAVDQHSQLQLYLDGPRDKCFTLIQVDVSSEGDFASKTALARYGLPELEQATTGDVLMAQSEATATTLAQHGCMVRHMAVSRLDEAAIGGLLMHWMVEVLAMAQLMDVNPYDQHAVEQGKILTRQLLQRRKDGLS